MAFMLFGAGAARAQTEEGASGGGIEEIVVTAQKRSESINKVGMSITAVTGEALVQKSISSASDLVRVVPGFTYTDAPRGTPVFAIRGVGFDDSTIGSASTVALYLDEVPISYPMEARFPTLDLERVEVLKGPQGILFGQNSTAGAINFIAAKPTDEVRAGFDASYGRFDTIELRGFMSAPVSDTLKVRISGMGVHSGPWQKSYTRDDELGKKRQFAGRVIAVWEPTSELKLTFNLNGWIDKSDTQAGQLQAVQPTVAGLVAANNPDWQYWNYPLAPNNARAADWDSNPVWPLRRDDNYIQGSVRLDYQFDEHLKLTSISAFQRYNQQFGLDVDGANLVDFIIYNEGSVRSLNQEIRLSGDYGDLKFIVGGNYSRDKTHQMDRYNYKQSSAFYGLSGANFFGYSGPFDSTSNFDQRIRSMAVFGNVDYAFGNLTLHGGLRYTKDKRSYVGCGSQDPGDGNLSGFQNIFFPLILGHSTNLQPGDCGTLNPVPGDFIPGFSHFKLDEDNVSWRAGVDFQATPTTLFYANVSRGYKSGSFPAVNANSAIQLEAVKQESVLVYEAGVKAGLLNRKLQFNAAGFYNDYKNKQLRGRVLDPFGLLGPLEKLLNVPKSRVYGAEVSVQAIPTRGLNIGASATYVNTKVTRDFFAYDPVGNLFNYKGLSFPHTPKWNLNGSIDYEAPISSGLNIFGGAAVTYHSRTISLFSDPDLISTVQLDPANKPGLFVDRHAFDERDYTIVDAQLGVADADGRWRAWIWGKNIFNQYYWTNATQSLDSIYRIAAMPATYGVTVSLRFGGASKVAAAPAPPPPPPPPPPAMQTCPDGSVIEATGTCPPPPPPPPPAPVPERG
jgi:outer membrane receptor protein involved in Fe transport